MEHQTIEFLSFGDLVLRTTDNINKFVVQAENNFPAMARSFEYTYKMHSGDVQNRLMRCLEKMVSERLIDAFDLTEFELNQVHDVWFVATITSNSNFEDIADYLCRFVPKDSANYDNDDEIDYSSDDPFSLCDVGLEI
jgi:hypothetical protein